MHSIKQREREEKHQQSLRAETDRIAKEAQSAKQGSRSNLRKEDFQPGAAAERLYMEHKELELRMQLRKDKKAAEERERLEQSRIAARPARAVSPAGIGAARDVGNRLHALQAEIAERKQKKTEEHVANEINKFKKVGADRAPAGADTCHSHLHEDGKLRQERLEQLRKEKDVREQKELAEKCGPGGRPVNAERIDELFREHADRLKRNNLVAAEATSRELSKALQVCSCGSHLQIGEPRCLKCGAKCSEPAAALDATGGGTTLKHEDLFTRQSEAKERRERSVADLRKRVEDQVYLVCGCGNQFEANTKERCRKCGARRPEAATAAPREKGADEPTSEPRAPADSAAAIVNSAVALRCGCTKAEVPSVGLRPLLEPLGAAIEAYREAAQGSETGGEGFSSLRTRSSQRLFMDGHLMDDVEAWHQQCEPDPIRQVEEDFDALIANAQVAQQQLLQMIGPPKNDSSRGVLWDVGARFPHPRAAKTALFAVNPGVKSREAAMIKALVDFQPAEGASRFRHVLDLARVCLVFSNCANLRSGLTQLMDEFEVVDVRNHYAPSMQSPLGERYVEVLVVLTEGLELPHVCEIRLEELGFFQAAEKAAPHLKRVCKGFATIYQDSGAHPAAIEFMARKVLRAPSEPHGIRVFRRHLARTFGSIPVAWRRVFGNGALTPYAKFKDACHQLGATSYQARSAEYWQEFDSGRSGCISLFELDPGSVVLLAKFRERLLSMVPDLESVDAEQLFARVSAIVAPPSKTGFLESSEFRTAAKAMGFNKAEADRVFSYLDLQGAIGGSMHVPRGAATISSKDLQWLLRLHTLVNLDAVMMIEDGADDAEAAQRRQHWSAGFSVVPPRGRGTAAAAIGSRPRSPPRPRAAWEKAVMGPGAAPAAQEGTDGEVRDAGDDQGQSAMPSSSHLLAASAVASAAAPGPQLILDDFDLEETI